MDCIKPSIPKWINAEAGFDTISEEELRDGMAEQRG